MPPVSTTSIDGGAGRYCLIQVADVSFAVHRERLLRDAPGDPLPAQKLAQLLAERGDKAGARARLRTRGQMCDRRPGVPPRRLFGRTRNGDRD